jgi:16S rRNA (adenine1518-N6/adenine1519-N6)-dimethyltransferase
MFGKAKKSLGQNFLNSDGAISAMLTAAQVVAGDVVLEIGPGRGALTRKLLAAGAVVVAIEKDDELFAPLQTEVEAALASGQLTLVHDDALTVDIQQMMSGAMTHAHKASYKLIANIPYYITGALIERFLSTDTQPTSATLLVQKEVAERIVARDGKGSILSISVKAYGAPEYVTTVKRGSFFPTPNVDSAIIHIANLSKDQFRTAGISEERFFEVVKAGFAHKRKHLGSNLSHLVTPETMASCNIPKEQRAETLTTEQWFCLARQ